jgi:hypothetical protein
MPVLSLTERIGLLERDLASDPPGFVMTADLPFAIFRYDPGHPEEGEWRVRREVLNLKTRVENRTGRRVHVVPLSELFWRSIIESEGLEALTSLERERGFRAAEQQVHTYLSDPDWRNLPTLLAEVAQEFDPRREYLFLTRATVFAPAAYRISALLEQMKGRLAVPTVLFYPGTWTGSLNYMGMRSDDALPGSYRVKIYGRET